MCLAALYWYPEQATPIKIVANRDEFRNRPAAAMHWWPDEPILAGKDLQAGGTWLGVNRDAKFALLTNIRPGHIGRTAERSRGELVSEFLSSDITVREYHRDVAARITEYGGFNLILGTIDELYWFSSDHPEGLSLSPGIYGLSNDALNTPWPKTVLARQQMAEQHELMATHLTRHNVLSSKVPAELSELPDTGIPLDWEQRLSSQTIVGGDYGTRCRSHLIIGQDKSVQIAEQQFDASGEEVSRVEFDFIANGDAD